MFICLRDEYTLSEIFGYLGIQFNNKRISDLRNIEIAKRILYIIVN